MTSKSKPSSYSIYQITCTATGLSYIGVTGDLTRRVRSHYYALKRGNHINPDMQRDFNLHGAAMWKAYLIYDGIEDKREAQSLEMRSIKERDTFHNGYNRTGGGNYASPPTWYECMRVCGLINKWLVEIIWYKSPPNSYYDFYLDRSENAKVEILQAIAKLCGYPHILLHTKNPSAKTCGVDDIIIYHSTKGDEIGNVLWLAISPSFAEELTNE